MSQTIIIFQVEPIRPLGYMLIICYDVNYFVCHKLIILLTLTHRQVRRQLLYIDDSSSWD